MWTLMLSFCVCVTLVMSLAFCLCWRKKTPKSDWLGLDGMVTQKNPDENVNHLSSVVAPSNPDITKAAGDDVDANKRSVPVVNTRRSLPDIPSEQALTVNWEPSGDNSSEHYATVGQYGQTSAKRQTLPNGVEARSSISQHSSLSQADDTFSPYERVKYDKVNSKEHPYAQVQPSTSRPPIYEEGHIVEEHAASRHNGASTSAEPSTSRSRPASAQSTLEIPAASAVAGGIAASPELPYMTPPVAQQQTQQHFSGDSQDSSKGYTSITVREPLANILAQTKRPTDQGQAPRGHLEQHYSTVSDDSDDVYTTIPDPNNQIYTSESETYAHIPAHPVTIEAEPHVEQPGPSRAEPSAERTDDLYEVTSQPAPPSVDSLKQVTAHSHSRQASSSSSVANISSPKPEKRQANSPLPPPPTTFEFHPDKPQAARPNLDDLYAKVHKNKKKSSSDEESSPEKTKLLPEVVVCEEQQYAEPAKLPREHNYETLRKSPRKASDPGYEKIRNEDPGYACINGPDSICSSDPGYEVLKQRAPSDLDPNYEELQDRSSNASDSAGYSRIKDGNNPQDGGYSVINKPRKSDDKSRTSSSFGSNSNDATSIDEPNYESMPSESMSDPNYAGLKSTGSESDPNYESVKYLDEPPYERLDDDSSKADSDRQGYERFGARGYENLDTSESSNGANSEDKVDPPYERLNNDTDSSEVPGYERVKAGLREKAVSSESSGSSGKCEEEPTYSTIRGGDAVKQDNDPVYHV